MCLAYCVGNALRHCNTQGMWNEPDVLQCTSRELITLETMVFQGFIQRESFCGGGGGGGGGGSSRKWVWLYILFYTTVPNLGGGGEASPQMKRGILFYTCHSQCVRMILMLPTLQAQKLIIVSPTPEQQILTVTTLIQQLVRATLPQTHSLLPNDLKASVRVLTIVIEILENNYNGSDINEVSINLLCLENAY